MEIFSVCYIFPKSIEKKKKKNSMYKLCPKGDPAQSFLAAPMSSGPPHNTAATSPFPMLSPQCTRTHTEPKESWHPNGCFFFKHAKTS